MICNKCGWMLEYIPRSYQEQIKENIRIGTTIKPDVYLAAIEKPANSDAKTNHITLYRCSEKESKEYIAIKISIVVVISGLINRLCVICKGDMARQKDASRPTCLLKNFLDIK